MRDKIVARKLPSVLSSTQTTPTHSDPGQRVGWLWLTAAVRCETKTDMVNVRLVESVCIFEAVDKVCTRADRHVSPFHTIDCPVLSRISTRTLVLSRMFTGENGWLNMHTPYRHDCFIRTCTRCIEFPPPPNRVRYRIRTPRYGHIKMQIVPTARYDVMVFGDVVVLGFCSYT